MTDQTPKRDAAANCDGLCVSRRTALAISAGGVAAGWIIPESGAAAEARPQPQGAATELNTYPRKRVGSLSKLKDGEPISFTYPLEQQPNFLVKLGAPAQGGVGPDRDIVAFSSLCTHMGGNLRGRYRHDLKAIGPCPFHFSTFDLAKSGIAVHASATERLPQVRLEIEGDDIYAVGVNGLIYGFRHNLRDGTLASGAVLSQRPGGSQKTMRG